MDAIWDEMTSVSGPHYKAELKAGKPDLVPGLLGRVSSVSFRRKHPFDTAAGPETMKDSLQPER